MDYRRQIERDVQMSRDLVIHETSVDSNILILNAFHGGERNGRCVQLTIQNLSFCQMTFKEAVETFKTMIADIEKLNEEYDAEPPWWEKLKESSKPRNVYPCGER